MCAGLLLALAAPGPVAAAPLLGSCTITVLGAGVMVPDPAIGKLDSARPGGTAARIRVNANSTLCWVLGLLDCYRVSAPPPAVFQSSPPGGDADVAFSTTYRIDGGGTVPGAVQTEVLNGAHLVDVDLAATRIAGVFAAGSYRAEVTVRCE